MNDKQRKIQNKQKLDWYYRNKKQHNDLCKFYYYKNREKRLNQFKKYKKIQKKYRALKEYTEDEFPIDNAERNVARKKRRNERINKLSDKEKNNEN